MFPYQTYSKCNASTENFDIIIRSRSDRFQTETLVTAKYFSTEWRATVGGTCHPLDDPYSNNGSPFSVVHKPVTPDCCGDQILYGGAQSLWVLRMELALCRSCNVHNFGVNPWVFGEFQAPRSTYQSDSHSPAVTTQTHRDAFKPGMSDCRWQTVIIQ
jgi:hypothetical protein